MAVRYSIDQVTLIAPGVWDAALEPADVRSLGRPTLETNGKSIVGIRGPALSGIQGLTFAPADVVVFAAGNTNRALIIELEKTNSASPIEPEKGVQKNADQKHFGAGDQAFVRSCRSLLDPSLAALGEELLRRIRQHHGEMLEEAQNRRWVNRPNNFFTIIPQNRNNSFRISIKGKPHTHTAKKLQIIFGRKGYSEFILKSRDELDEAVALILESARR